MNSLSETLQLFPHTCMLISPDGRLEGGPAASASSAAWLCAPSRVIKQANEAKVPLPFETMSALGSLSMYILSM